MPGASAHDRPVVLLVEEEPSERDALVAHLSEAGYEVVAADDSDRALAVLQSRQDVRAIVTDAHVPGRIDGYELARTVRETSPAIATIMMSGHSDPSSGPVPEGAAFVAKPYILEHLLPTLTRLLRRTS
jgi:CheY-like chemotaxis protein